MAMLAEPRRKQKWTLNPRGKHWSEDTNKFGQKMLERMGWSSGKGLGAKEQGMTEHIRVSFKSDTAGIGFKKDDMDKAWTEHQDGFNDFLQELQKSQTTDSAELPEMKESLSGMSLELKSKQSRARVHYRKFTRGKDVNRYSSKDLANIFGQKDLNTNSNLKQEKPEEVEDAEPVGGQDTRGGVITINSGSMADYFKKKGHDFSKSSNTVKHEKIAESESENEYAGFGFSQALKKRNHETCNGLETSSNYAFENPCLRVNSPEDTSSGSSKVSKKRKNRDYEDSEPRLSNHVKRLKENCTVESSYNKCFVNPALNLESQSDEAIGGQEFEVSRAQFGLTNSGLDLTDESHEKKRVTFNDHIEYSTDPMKKKKGKATLDKFEVENKKHKKKRRQSEDANNSEPVGFVNQALDVEDVSEEINDNELNEVKSKKSKKKKGSRASILETIVETPEEDKEVPEEPEESKEATAEKTRNLSKEASAQKETKKKKKKKKSEKINTEETDDTVHAELDEVVEEVKVIESQTTEEIVPSKTREEQEKESSKDKKKKKKKKKEKDNAPSGTEQQEATILDDATPEGEVIEETTKHKKSKKKKPKIASNDVSKEEKEISDKENTNADGELSGEKKRKKVKKSRKSIDKSIDDIVECIAEETVKESCDTEVHLENSSDDLSLKKDEESFETPRMPRSPWNEKARMSKKLLKSLFQRNSVQNFPGSNIHEIKGYGVDL